MFRACQLRTPVAGSANSARGRMTRTAQLPAAADTSKPLLHSPMPRWLSLSASLLLHSAVYLTAMYFLPGMRGYGDGSLVKGNGDASVSGVFVMSPAGG